MLLFFEKKIKIKIKIKIAWQLIPPVPTSIQYRRPAIYSNIPSILDRSWSIVIHPTALLTQLLRGYDA
ncbi:hypothetical protein I7I53_08379 [Histoplasma capsulatum var. duboisii H88]|uniref:Uncharacterized protein n=1 Tax=Ajellomyces capsulatus (strain H88) TaxID=544711 RepID=A0A8A1LFL9_AJEC8|nr:hypothetical protein I7I53_08379 [Histoplasma capsulatum var. duboisii H88]